MSYDPTTGRFMSEDPIAFDSGDVNISRYVKNSPTNSIDPSGLLTQAEQKLQRDRLGTDAQKIVDIIIEAMEASCGDAVAAFTMIYNIRNDPGSIDNDQLASADHFFNAWTAQNYYNDWIGPGKASGMLGSLAGWGGNFGYMFIKESPLGSLLPRDKPGSPPTGPSIAQWQWGHRGGTASSWYNTKMCIGSEEWKSFIEWLKSMT